MFLIGKSLTFQESVGLTKKLEHDDHSPVSKLLPHDRSSNHYSKNSNNPTKPRANIVCFRDLWNL